MMQWIVSSSVLLAVVIALRFLLRGRIHPKLQYALWALALIRLLIPISFGSTPISVENPLQNAHVVQQLELAERVEHFTYWENGTVTGFYIPSLPEWAVEQAPYTQELVPMAQTFTTQQAQTLTRIRSAAEILTQIWVAGMIVMGGVFLLSNTIFAVKLKKTAKHLEDKGLAVFVTEEVETPCLFGIFRPKVYLPTGVAQEETHRTYAVAHELTHYHHCDHVWALLRSVCLVVHWYNPLVWWAAVLSRTDGEIACDASTIAKLGEEHRSEYGRVLIDLTVRKRTDLLSTATTMTGSAKGLKERISRIAKRPKMALYTLIAVLLVAAIAVGCTMTGGKNGQDTPEDSTVETSTESSSNSTDESQESNTQNTEGGTNTDEHNAQTLVSFHLEGTAFTAAERLSIQALFEKVTEGSAPGARYNWYNLILSSAELGGFQTPQDVSFGHLFNKGYSLRFGPQTQEEAAWLEANAKEPHRYDSRITTAEMNEVLEAYLGLTLEQTNRKDMERFLYYPEGDCYFIDPAGAAGAVNVQVTQANREADGTIHLVFRGQVKGYVYMRLHPTGNGEIPYRVSAAYAIAIGDEIPT